jgi:hypothetical protein
VIATRGCNLILVAGELLLDGDGEGYLDCGTPSKAIQRTYLPVVQFDSSLCDCEADAEAAGLCAARAIKPIEGSEDRLQL